MTIDLNIIKQLVISYVDLETGKRLKKHLYRDNELIKTALVKLLINGLFKYFIKRCMIANEAFIDRVLNVNT